jgi:hypothetical protein
MLLADLLLSGPPLLAALDPVPTVDDLAVVFRFDSERVPRGLCQKIAIVSPNLVVGWSGSYDTARDVISELRRRVVAERYTNEALQRDLNNLLPSYDAKNSIGLVGFIRDPDNRIAQFGRNYIKLNTKVFGDVGLLGSGLDDFEKFLTRNETLPVADNHLQLNVLQRSVGFGLSMSGALLTFEVSSGAGLTDLYGGGYEIAVSERGEFKKIDDVLYAFWSVDVEGEQMRGNFLPSRVFRYAYKDDLLRIRSVSFVRRAKTTSISEQLFLVPPVYRDLRSHEKADTSKPDLNARWLCNFFVVRYSDGRSKIFTKVAHQIESREWIRFEDRAEGVGVQVSQRFLEEVGRAILRGPPDGP